MPEIEHSHDQRVEPLLDTGHNFSVISETHRLELGELAISSVTQERSPYTKYNEFITESTDTLKEMSLFPSRTASEALRGQGLGVIGFDCFDDLQEAEDALLPGKGDEDMVANLLLCIAVGCIAQRERTVVLDSSGCTSIELSEAPNKQVLEKMGSSSLKLFFELRGSKNIDQSRNELQKYIDNLKRREEAKLAAELEKAERRTSAINEELSKVMIYETPNMPYNLAKS